MVAAEVVKLANPVEEIVPLLRGAGRELLAAAARLRRDAEAVRLLMPGTGAAAQGEADLAAGRATLYSSVARQYVESEIEAADVLRTRRRSPTQETSERQGAEADRARVPRVLVIVSGGVADFVVEGAVEVEVFDFDNYRADPVRTGGVPLSFAALGTAADVPLDDWNGLALRYADQEGRPARYSGRIVHVGDGVAVQESGRGEGVVHCVGVLDRIPEVGRSVSIEYHNGIGAVSIAKARVCGRGQ